MRDTEGHNEVHLLFAQALVQLARDYGVSSFEGSIRLDWKHRDAGWDDGPVRVSWSQGRHGDDSMIGLRSERYASVPEIAPNGASVPPMVYFEDGRFLSTATRQPESEPFHARWEHRSSDFPQGREAGLAALNESTREWVLKRYP